MSSRPSRRVADSNVLVSIVNERVKRGELKVRRRLEPRRVLQRSATTGADDQVRRLWTVTKKKQMID
jgi:hypothetical protein